MQAWENFLTIQQQELGKDPVDKWLRNLKILRFDACNLYLEAQEIFQINWFEEHIRPKISKYLFNNNNKSIKVHLTLKNQNSEKKKGKQAPTAPPAPAKRFEILFDASDPSASFSTFVCGSENQMVYRLLCDLSGFNQETGRFEAPKIELCTFNPIYIFGPPGSGKTHLLMATCSALRSHGKKVIYVRAETFTEHVVSAIRAGEMQLFRNLYRNVDVLLVDNIHVLSKKGATQEEFFHTFNTLHLAGKQIIIASNFAPNELQFIEPRLISRFEWGISLPVSLLNKEELKLFLTKKSEAIDFVLHPKVIDFLIETFKTGTRQLTKALDALVLRTHLRGAISVLKAPLTVESAKHYLKDLIEEEEKNILTPEKIIQKIAEYFGIKPEDILGKSQTRDCVLPRQLAMYFCRNEIKMPFTKIGDLFERDHSTVMTSVKIIQKGIQEDGSEIAQSVNIISKKIQNQT